MSVRIWYDMLLSLPLPGGALRSVRAARRGAKAESWIVCGFGIGTEDRERESQCFGRNSCQT